MSKQFVKYDELKVRPSLVEPDYILGTARVLTLGAEKYTVDNWKNATLEEADRYRDALMRHVLAYLGGEDTDPETGESHLYHASCNLMFLDWFDKHFKPIETTMGE